MQVWRCPLKSYIAGGDTPASYRMLTHSGDMIQSDMIVSGQSVSTLK